MAAQIMPNPLDRLSSGCKRQLQQSDITGTTSSCCDANRRDRGSPRMRIGGDLAADLAEMMVHGGGIADRHDQRCRFAAMATAPTHRLRKSRDPWVLPAGCRFAPTPGQTVLLADASLVLKPYLDFAHRVLAPPGLVELQSNSCENSACAVASACGCEDAVPTSSTLSDAAAGRCSTDCNQCQTPASRCVAR